MIVPLNLKGRRRRCSFSLTQPTVSAPRPDPLLLCVSAHAAPCSFTTGAAARPGHPAGRATDRDGRWLRRYRRRRTVERTIGWLGNFRRLTVRYDRLLATYGGFFHLACALLVLRRVLK